MWILRGLEALEIHTNFSGYMLGRGLGRTGVLSDRKKHGYPSRNALRNTLACFLAGEGTPLPPYKGVFLRIIIT